MDEGAGGARLHCLSPGRAQVEELVGAPGWPDQVPDLANRLSAVLRLDWGSSFWILGADLESSGGKPCWEDLPPLHDHAGLKLPHHGSKGAHSARWADSEGGRQPRLWALTPFNGASLPNPPEDCLVGACFDSTGRCIERYCRHGALEILA